MEKLIFRDALERMLTRLESTQKVAASGLPHWARSDTGEWTLTPDGDWTGGAYIGKLWLAHQVDASRFPREKIHAALSLMRPRALNRTAFKGFGFYHGAAMGDILFKDADARADALLAAKSLAGMYDEKLGLIPLGEDAEEAFAVGAAESSIDSLQATGLLFWAADETGDQEMERVAAAHLKRVLEIHVRDDGSIVQSSTLDRANGAVLHTHTHKGYSDVSTWGRAQGWGMLYSAHASVVRPNEPLWRAYAIRTLDWWIDNVPSDLVAFWDFDDPAIPDTNRDTAATTIAVASALRLAQALGPEQGEKYRSFAENTVAALTSHFLTPTSVNDKRPTGMLTGGCFTKKTTVRAIDSVQDAELVFGSYFLFEALAVLTDTILPGKI